MIFFSPSTRGFYSAEIHGEAIPADSVRITARRHQQLLEAQSAGAVIEAAPRGPVARFVKPTLETSRAAAVRGVKRQARRRILAIAPYWRQLNDLAVIALPDAALTGWDAAMQRRQAIDDVRVASDRLEVAIAAMSAEQLAAFDAGDDAHWSDPA
jgi:hypothetical protein